MDLTIVVSLIMIGAGLFRLYLTRSGKLPFALGIQKYFPWLFIGMGVILLMLALTE